MIRTGPGWIVCITFLHSFKSTCFHKGYVLFVQHVTFETLADCPDMRHTQADTGPDDKLIKINAPDSDISTAFASQTPPCTHHWSDQSEAYFHSFGQWEAISTDPHWSVMWVPRKWRHHMVSFGFRSQQWISFREAKLYFFHFNTNCTLVLDLIKTNNKQRLEQCRNMGDPVSRRLRVKEKTYLSVSTWTFISSNRFWPFSTLSSFYSK